jgi:mRNA interferase MazF
MRKQTKSPKNGNSSRNIRRGDIFYADLTPSVGSEQGGVRPVVVIQNDVGNQHSPTVIVAAITTQSGKPRQCTHINLDARLYGLEQNSTVLLEQVRTLDRRRLQRYCGRVDGRQMNRIDKGLIRSLGIGGALSGRAAVS